MTNEHEHKGRANGWVFTEAAQEREHALRRTVEAAIDNAVVTGGVQPIEAVCVLAYVLVKAVAATYETMPACIDALRRLLVVMEAQLWSQYPDKPLVDRTGQ
ncbi:MAG: hypothetical protein VW405_05970 [Rhodospirillaceae bacterium]